MLTHPDLARHVGKFYGKYSGTVTGVEDTDNLGRVKVKVPPVFPVDHEVTARPCLPFGHFFIPAVGTKVWIEFEAGDPNFPIWVGAWPPSGSTPPEAAINPPENRVIHTPSGHIIEILDKQGEEKITIKHKDNSFVAIDKKGSVLIANKNGSHLFLDADTKKTNLVEEHGNLITMGDSGISVVSKDGTLIEIASGKVKITAAQAVQLTATSIVLNGAGVGLGQNATHPAVHGDTFAAGYNAFALHTHGCAVGPTTPPIPPGLPLLPGAGLSLSVKVAS